MKESTSRRRFTEALEMVTSVMVIAGVLLFGFVVYRSFIHPAEAVQTPEPVAGTVLPALPGYNWREHSETLVLAMRQGMSFLRGQHTVLSRALQSRKRRKNEGISH